MIVNGVTYPDPPVRRTSANQSAVVEPPKPSIPGYDPMTNTLALTNESVSGRVTGLMSNQDPLQQQARTQAAQQVNRRGLLNSSIGVQAGQVAGYQAALPIASQEASQAHNTNIQGRDLQTRKLMGDAANATQMSVATQNAITQLTIARENIAADAAAQERTLAWQSGENVLNRQAQVDLQGNQFAFQGDQAQLDRDQTMHIASLNLNANDRNQAGTLISAAGQNRAVQIASIANNPELPASVRQQLIDDVNAEYQADIEMIDSLYPTLDITWTPPAGNSATNASTNVGTL